MLRSLRPKLAALMKNNSIIKKLLPASAISTIAAIEDHNIDMDIQDFQYIEYLKNENIDGWQLRRAFNEFLGMDAVPNPQVIIAGLHACRRVDDIALAIRFLEGCRYKCGAKMDDIYPYMLQEIRPTLAELGIPSVEDIGYDLPELALKPTHYVEIDKGGCPITCD